MKYRLVVDLRQVNTHLRQYSLRYERLRDFGHLLQRRDWMVGFDLKNAYHHLRIHDKDQHYLQFRIEGELFQCVALPFGLALSPHHFTHLILPIIRFLRIPARSTRGSLTFQSGWLAGNTALAEYSRQYARGIPVAILAYLDDFLAAGQCRTEVKKWTAAARAVFHTLGFEFKEAKCEWDPVQEKRHLGIVIDTKRALFLVPGDKCDRIKCAARALLNTQRAPARQVAQFCGIAISIHLAFPPARFFLQSLYRDLATKRSWRDWIRLSTQAKEDLRAWCSLDRWNGRAVAPDMVPLIGTLATDACPSGWGATFQTPDRPLMMARGFFNRAQAHINVRELQAVTLAIQSFFPRPVPPRSEPRRIRLKVDNQVVMYMLRHLTTPSMDLMKEVRTLFYLLEARKLLLEPEYIPSQDNTIPDRLSRLSNKEDYRLARPIFQRIQARFGTRTIDRFASSRNRQVALYNSLEWDLDSEGVDAFQQHWEGERNWCNPPWSLLPRLVSFLRERPQVEAVILTPEWPQALWYQPLSKMAVDSMLIQRMDAMFTPGHPEMASTLPRPRWNLRAFHVVPRTGTRRTKTRVRHE